MLRLSFRYVSGGTAGRQSIVGLLWQFRRRSHWPFDAAVSELHRYGCETTIEAPPFARAKRILLHSSLHRRRQSVNTPAPGSNPLSARALPTIGAMRVRSAEWYTDGGDGVRVRTTREEGRGDNSWSRLSATRSFRLFGVYSSVGNQSCAPHQVALSLPPAHRSPLLLPRTNFAGR
jgi:hypothetical protein